MGVFAYGKNGNGKTLCACVIGKEAIKKGYTVRFTFLGEVISAFMNSMYNEKQKEQLKADILGVDFLILDDLDKAFISDNSKYVNSILDSLFRTRVQNNLPVIMTANKTMEDILTSNSEEVFSKSLLSLFDESLLPIAFIGADRRADLKKEARKRFLDD
jgi:DNA replication protein DnaC